MCLLTLFTCCLFDVVTLCLCMLDYLVFDCCILFTFVLVVWIDMVVLDIGARMYCSLLNLFGFD